MRISRHSLHLWEEPCISGTAGSGTVFFSGCSLRCVFCQNYRVSRSELGHEISEDELIGIFYELAEKGACNINLVTPTHFADSIARCIRKARQNGFELPFVWNSSGYETTETLKTLSGLIDIYLPDFKYCSSTLSQRYSGAADYFVRACDAIREMKRQQPENVIRDGIMKKGVIIRHLVLPGCTDDSLDVLDWLRDNFGSGVTVSVMSQYTPLRDGLPDELGRKLSDEEYNKVTTYAMMIGIKNGYFQEGSAASESFVPEFS